MGHAGQGRAGGRAGRVHGERVGAHEGRSGGEGDGVKRGGKGERLASGGRGGGGAPSSSSGTRAATWQRRGRGREARDDGFHVPPQQAAGRQQGVHLVQDEQLDAGQVQVPARRQGGRPAGRGGHQVRRPAQAARVGGQGQASDECSDGRAWRGRRPGGQGGQDVRGLEGDLPGRGEDEDL